jgi:hypothetical protein
MVAGIVEAMAGQVERALKQQEEISTMLKGPTKPLWQNEKMGLKPEQYNAWEKYIKEEYTDAENELVKETEKRESAEKKANDRQVGETQHYKKLSIQPWDAMEEWLSPDEFRGFLIGNSLKYLARAGKKGPYREDIQKAHHYLEKLLEML